MLYKEIFRVLGYFLLVFSCVLLVPACVAAYYQYFSWFMGQPQAISTIDFLITIMISISLAGLFLFLGRNALGQIYRREAIAIVVIIWFMTPALSAIPFLTSGTLTNPYQAFFEMVSGFTTTGSTIMHAKAFNDKGEEVPIVKTVEGARDTTYIFYGTIKPIRNLETGEIVKEGVEAIGKGLLFWRSFSQWLGGGGIIILFVAVLPALGVGGKVLFQSEVSGPVKEGTTPRIKETAMQLWKVYLVLTILQIICLMVFNSDLSLFEASAITFSTLSTGGLSTQNASIAGYHSISIEWIVIIFMLAGSINFSLYTFLFKGKFYRIIDIELITYFIVLMVFSFLIIYFIQGTFALSLTNQNLGLFTWPEAIRHGLFQLVSAQTSTGFVTIDYDVWPYSAQTLLLIAMFVGGMSGSTSGGIKIIREYMLFRLAQYRVESLFRPDHLKIFKIGDREVTPATAFTVLSFFVLVIGMATIGTLCYVFDGIDLETAFSLTACMLNNTGMSFRAAGPQSSCAFLSDFSLAVSSFLMILGRLEYFAVFALLVPAFWQNDT